MKHFLAFLVAAAALAIPAAGGIYWAKTAEPKKPEPFTHLTIYLEGQILEDGGGVIVAARQIPEAEWRALSAGDNPAAGDLDNPKRKQVKEGDRLFGAVVSSPATTVEFFYPEGGSYTFNFAPKSGIKNPELKTKRISIGSGRWQDAETGEQIELASLSLIYVPGSRYDEGWARIMEATFTNAVPRGGASAFGVTKYLGVRVISLTPEGIAKYVKDTQN